MDIRHYTDDELVLLVYNNESLYLDRFNINKDYLRELGIIYTVTQYNNLIDKIQSESNE